MCGWTETLQDAIVRVSFDASSPGDISKIIAASVLLTSLVFVGMIAWKHKQDRKTNIAESCRKLSMGIVKCSKFMEFVDANEGFFWMTGISRSAAAGDGWRGVIHDEDRQRVATVVARAAAHRCTYSCVFLLRRFAGSYSAAVEWGWPCANGGGAFAGYQSACCEVKDFAAVTSAAQPMLAELGMPAELLRTVAAVLATFGKHGRKEIACHVDGPADATEHVVDELSSAPQFAECDVERMLDDVVSRVQLAARLHGLSVNIRSPVCGPAAYTDSALLSGILMTLVGNAFRFCVHGGVTVEWDCATLGEEPAVQISITDTGIGLTPQVHTSVEAVLGTPCGMLRAQTDHVRLSACSRAVRALRGRIAVSEPSPAGATFVVLLPTAPQAPAKNEGLQKRRSAPLSLSDACPLPSPDAQDCVSRPRASSVPVFRSSGPRVLVVDDLGINRTVALRLLSRLGCIAHAVANGKEAVDHCARHTCDIVLMDCHMPVMNGYEAAAVIGELHPSVRVIALTADVTEENRAKCTAVGMIDFLTKPIMLPDIVRILEREGFTKTE